jgi:predicted Zn finger-like uncharacterized protein
MIAACPKCEARYRVDETQIGSDGARLKCAKCQAVFRVRAPAAPAPAPEPAPSVAPQPAPKPPVKSTESAATPAARASESRATPSAFDQGGTVDRDRLVLVADPSAEVGKTTVEALSSWGLEPILVHDGVEAMLTIQRMLPRVVILDAALPKMYGFQVCEVIKRNESLRGTAVVLVGAIHNSERYRRPPTELYGANLYLEHPDLPDGLKPLLRQVGLDLDEDAFESQPARSSPDPAAGLELSPAPDVATPTQVETPVPAEAGDEFAEEREKAERLARIVVSDIVLYQPDKFQASLAQGNVVEAMDVEIEEGRSLFRQRIDERVRDERDFIVEELVRVARERGMK